MDISTTDALTYAGSGPLVMVILSLIKGMTGDFVPNRLLPLVAIGLAYAWGGVLWATGRFDGDAAVFLLLGFSLGLSAIGTYSALQAASNKDAAGNPTAPVIKSL